MVLGFLLEKKRMLGFDLRVRTKPMKSIWDNIIGLRSSGQNKAYEVHLGAKELGFVRYYLGHGR